jgi:septation ring formation regulator EzrA
MRSVEELQKPRFGGLYDEEGLVDRGLDLKEKMHDATNHLQSFKFEQAKDDLNDLIQQFDKYLSAVDKVEQEVERLREKLNKKKR